MIKLFRKIFDEERVYLLMLVILLSALVIEPIITKYFKVGFVLDIFLTAVFVFGVMSVSYKKHAATIALILVIPVLIINWSSNFVEMDRLILLSDFLGVLFFIFLIRVILKNIFRQEEITREVIYGAIVVYLLMGLAWASTYRLLESLFPGSFHFPEYMLSAVRNTMFYYSYVTLTTLGYGDITPVTAIARSLAVLEAIIGQMYIAVLMARLVGTYISQSILKK
jgi:hypothetical protein